MRINRNNGIMKFPLFHYSDLFALWKQVLARIKTRTRTRTRLQGQGKGPDPKDQDKDFKYVLKESLMARTRISITGSHFIGASHLF